MLLFPLVLRIGFVPSIYAVEEDLGRVTLNVAIVDGRLSQGILVIVEASTQDESAIGKPYTR